MRVLFFMKQHRILLWTHLLFSVALVTECGGQSTVMTWLFPSENCFGPLSTWTSFRYENRECSNMDLSPSQCQKSHLNPLGSEFSACFSSVGNAAPLIQFQSNNGMLSVFHDDSDCQSLPVGYYWNANDLCETRGTNYSIMYRNCRDLYSWDNPTCSGPSSGASERDFRMLFVIENRICKE